MTLYSGPLSMFGAKAQIAAIEEGPDFDLIMVAYYSPLGYSPKHPEVLRVNPKGQVPVLVHAISKFSIRPRFSNIWRISSRRPRCGRADRARPAIGAPFR